MDGEESSNAKPSHRIRAVCPADRRPGRGEWLAAIAGYPVLGDPGRRAGHLASLGIARVHIGNSFGARVAALLGPKAAPELIADVQRVLRATRPRGFMHGIKLGLASGYSPAKVGLKLTMPVLLIQGSADRVNPAEENTHLLIKVLQHGRLETLEEIGDLPEVEAPLTVSRLLRAFFE